MSVRMTPTVVMKMQCVPILLEAILAPVHLATLEMERIVMVMDYLQTLKARMYCINKCHSTDIDECATGVANCAIAATCMNTDGNYTCSCNIGYTGDGITCTSKLCILHCTTKFSSSNTLLECKCSNVGMLDPILIRMTLSQLLC